MYQSVLQKQKESLSLALPSPLIEREKLADYKKELKHNLIKLITGPRRVGKSTFATQLLKGKKFGYVNFDEPDFDFNRLKYEQLTKSIDEVYNRPKYLLFDEIQNLPKWQIYLNSLQRINKNLIVTGSNAKMLSSDLATVLTGRSIEINLQPFSLKEALAAKKNLTVDDFLLKGSYPEAIVKLIDPEVYFQSLFNTSIIKDVVVRYSLRNPSYLENTAKYLLANIANLYSFQSIGKKLDLSVPTVIDYIKKLEETYLFFQLPRFSNKQSEINRSNKKIFTIDFAFAKYNTAPLMNNFGSALENAVFVEFLRKGYICGKTLFYFKTIDDYEIDFVVIGKNRNKILYQVCYSLEDEKTLSREVLSLDNAEKEIGTVDEKIIITKSTSIRKIKDVKILDFVSFCAE